MVGHMVLVHGIGVQVPTRQQMEKIHKTEEEWRGILTPKQYRIMREKDTESPFTCELKEYKGEGFFNCFR